jgi:tRNA A37 N6-isopentenylltransferase MiaA
LWPKRKANKLSFDAVLIAGPTASGKSAQALALAEEIGGVLINADSMQVYREAPILTAQPRPADKARAASAVRPCQRTEVIRWVVAR